MLKRTLPLLPFALAAAFSAAQTEIVVTANSPAGDAYSAPTNTFIPITSTPGFGYNNIRTNSIAGINGTHPRSGDGSVQLSLADSSGKADIEYYSATPMGLLSDLTTFDYDFFKDVSSPDSEFGVSARLFIDLDGNLSTTNDRGIAIYEPVYNNSGNTPEGVWMTENVTATSGDFWIRFAGQNQFQGENGPIADGVTLDYLTDPSTTGLIAPTNNGTAVVYGFNMGIGSGFSQAFSGAADNLTIGFNGDAGTRYNFEVEQPVPEPATMAALGLGAAALLRRRKRASK